MGATTHDRQELEGEWTVAADEEEAGDVPDATAGGAAGAAVDTPGRRLLQDTREGDILALVSVAAPYGGFANKIHSASMAGLMVLP